jgi:PAS domain S-box-containing protein
MEAGSGGSTPQTQHESGASQDKLGRAAAEAERLTRFYETLVSNTPDLVYAFALDYTFVYANRALLAMWGRSLEDAVGKRLIEVGYEPWHADMHEREIDGIVATGQPVRGEVGFPHATLGWRVYDYILSPVFDAGGAVEWISGITRDITEIKRAEEHLTLLVNELNHRVKNTLATIQSIAAQTFRGDAAAPDARAAFEARLIALSDVHTVLTATNWEGASLREIAGRALAPFRGTGGDPERFAVEGPNVQLRPQVALALAMAFHELASNAVKYGALSTDSGRVTLHWAVDEDRLRLAWRENGGPEVSPPVGTGFGSRLIERGLARELNGEVRLDYPPAGILCTMDIPLPTEGEPDAAR